MWEASSGGRRVRKSRARVGVRTEWRVRRTGSGEWRRRVRRKWDWRAGGRALKWDSSEGRVSNVVRDKSGSNGEPWREPGGDGGGRGFFLDCGSSSHARFFPYRSTASASPTTGSGGSSRRNIRHPSPRESCSSSFAPSPSLNVAREPPGKTRGNWRKLLGNVACSSGYSLGSVGSVGEGKGGNWIGAYVVVVVVVVTTLDKGQRCHA